MTLARRTLIGGALAVALGATGCGVDGTTPTPPRSPSSSSRPRSAFDAPGSIEKALDEALASLESFPHHSLTISRDELVVQSATQSARWLDGAVSVTRGGPKSKTSLPSPLEVVDWTTFADLEQKARAVLGDAPLDRVVLGNDGTWGRPLVQVSTLTHHGPSTRQLETTLEPVAELDFNDDTAVTTAVTELQKIGLVTTVTEFRMHAKNIGVAVGWHPRFGPQSEIVHVHRGAKKRASYLLDLADGTPEPTLRALFPLTEVRTDIIRKGAAELKAAPGAWKAIVRKERDDLVHTVEAGRGASARYDAEGKRIG